MRERLARDLAHGDLQVPMLPEAAARVVALATRPEADAESLARLIATDQALAANVMRVAGSAATLPAQRIHSLAHAIAWLGLDEVADVAFTAAVQGRLLNVPGQKPMVLRLWRRAVTSALWAREIAAVARGHAEAAYLCGLLHQIGLPVALLAAADVARQHSLRLGEHDHHMLMDEFGMAVGEEVARRWHLPAAVESCIRWWRDPASAPAHRDEVRTVNLAHHLAELSLEQGPDFARCTLEGAPILDDLGITPAVFTALLDRAERVLVQARAW